MSSLLAGSLDGLGDVLQFKRNSGNVGGSLVQFQPGEDRFNALPFSIGKVLVVSDIGVDDVRGNHAHHQTEEIMVPLSGGFTVELHDGRGRECRVKLNAGEPAEVEGADSTPAGTVDALLLHPRVWRVMRDFEPDTVMLIVADTPYDETDYIRDYDAFLEHATGWDGPGGSYRA